MNESPVQSAILLALGSQRDIRMFRNLVGEGFVGIPPHKLQRVTFGLVPGSGDLIGYRSYTIRPEDVGRTIAVFTSVEVKRPRNSHTQKNQLAWRDSVQSRGGIAIISKSPAEALHDVLSWHPPEPAPAAPNSAP